MALHEDWAGRLGRFKSPDGRNYAEEYAMEKHVMGFSPETLPHLKVWSIGPILDQGDTSECTAFAWRAHLNAEPHAHPDLGPEPHDLYVAEKAIDGYPGIEGSTVHAGAQILKEKGVIESDYLWGHAEWTLRKWLLLNGPAVIGINWYASMFYPDEQGIIHIPDVLDWTQGAEDNYVAGGHALLVFGYDYYGFGLVPSQPGKGAPMYQLQNSWGTGWGKSGRFFVPQGDMARLIAEDGEIADALNWLGYAH